MSRYGPWTLEALKMWRTLRWAFLLALLAGGAIAAYAWWWLKQPMPLAQPTVEITIEPGTAPRRVAQQWVDAGVQVPADLLYAWFRLSGRSPQIRAGTYEIGRGTTPRLLLDILLRGDEAMYTVRFIEGWTFAQLRAALATAPSLKHDSKDMSEAQLMAAIGVPGQRAEGRFFPDTYAYGRKVSDLVVLRQAYAAMQRRLESAWAERTPDLPLASIEDLLTLASIVEKETGIEGDRTKVASVFVNRLRVGMPLQTDPTVIYGLGPAFDGNLRKRDLLADGPYNTYTRKGLPPTPIALPGAASIKATAQPAASKWLYFVARGDGSSVFSENLADHNRAVNQYQRGSK
jgi:UPF0755 protein